MGNVKKQGFEVKKLGRVVPFLIALWIERHAPSLYREYALMGLAQLAWNVGVIALSMFALSRFALGWLILPLGWQNTGQVLWVLGLPNPFLSVLSVSLATLLVGFGLRRQNPNQRNGLFLVAAYLTPFMSLDRFLLFPLWILLFNWMDAKESFKLRF